MTSNKAIEGSHPLANSSKVLGAEAPIKLMGKQIGKN